MGSEHKLESKMLLLHSVQENATVKLPSYISFYLIRLVLDNYVSWPFHSRVLTLYNIHTLLHYFYYYGYTIQTNWQGSYRNDVC